MSNAISNVLAALTDLRNEARQIASQLRYRTASPIPQLRPRPRRCPDLQALRRQGRYAQTFTHDGSPGDSFPAPAILNECGGPHLALVFPVWPTGFDPRWDPDQDSDHRPPSLVNEYSMVLRNRSVAGLGGRLAAYTITSSRPISGSVFTVRRCG